MKQIADGVYLEDEYNGVTVGAIIRPDGAVLIDAPLVVEDSRLWLSALRGLGVKSERYLVNLDAHNDRTLGCKGAESNVVTHAETARLIQERPSIFKAQQIDSGAEWEGLTGLSGTRWVTPSLIFTNQMQLHIGGSPVWLTHHPGPQPGAIWVELPEEKIVFIGDAVMIKQPPFLSEADLDAWIDTLDLLLKDYSDYKIYSSRCGEIKEKHIKDFKKLLQETRKQLERVSKRRNTVPEDTEKLVDKLLNASGAAKKYKKEFSQRLRYGLRNYYIKHYTNTHQED